MRKPDVQLTTREAERIFDKLEVEVVKSTHHVRGFVTYHGTRILPLHYSNGRKDMPGHVPKRFAKSLMLSLNEFAELKRCTMTKDTYFGILQKRGHLPSKPVGADSGQARG
jgi:hypothetical protein